ncbi:MAG: hypothetical protein SH856_10520 [Flavobacteriales bacterium]|nr:hypothetical protein [Flavobacteriales bacterium]
MGQKILVISIYLTIFLSSIVFFKEPVEGYLSYIVFLFLFPVFLFKYGIPKPPLLIFLPLFISGIVYIEIGSNTYGQFFKIFTGLFMSVVFYHFIIELYNHNVKQLFTWYLKGAIIVSYIGLVQVVSYYVGFRYGYDYGWLLNKWSVPGGESGIRMNSIFSEPANFAAVIAPAFFIAVHNLAVRHPVFISKRNSIIISIAYLLTFSSLGITGIFVGIVLLLLNFGFVRYAIIFIPLFIFSFDYAYKNIPDFSSRLDGTINIFSTRDVRDYEIHGSSFVLYNNAHVAYENFIRNPLFGTGLGSHPVAFDKYSYTNLQGVLKIEFNKQDANSMFLRLMSETGLYGLVFMLLLLFKCWVWKSRSVEREYWIMSNALGLMIMLYLFRQGHYFLNGFPFFIWLYYYIWKINREQKIAQSQEVGIEAADNSSLILPDHSKPVA